MYIQPYSLILSLDLFSSLSGTAVIKEYTDFILSQILPDYTLQDRRHHAVLHIQSATSTSALGNTTFLNLKYFFWINTDSSLIFAFVYSVKYHFV